MIDTLKKLSDLMKSHGARRLYFKILAENDNSKNQVYLGGNYSALNILPYGDVSTDTNVTAGSKCSMFKAHLEFAWIDESGKYEAPNAKLILYPKYPEIRFSGFLMGCCKAPSQIMTQRKMGRVLFFGITNQGQILGFAVDALHPLANAVNILPMGEADGVLREMRLDGAKDTHDELLAKLLEIHQKGWIDSSKLDSDGTRKLYSASNAGGFTLEAELGVLPNSFAKPDYLGWEVKQYGVNDFQKYTAKSPVTLMTPEPTGGIYFDKGVKAFINKFGYWDQNNRTGRKNFGGVYKNDGEFNHLTKLKLEMVGYCLNTGKIQDVEGGIAFVTGCSRVAALWKFEKLIEHWKTKHAQAAYIPSLSKKNPNQYCYGKKVTLCEGTDFSLFLKAVADCHVYIDPALKMEKINTQKPAIKRRNQFRIKHSELKCLYHLCQDVDLA